MKKSLIIVSILLILATIVALIAFNFINKPVEDNVESSTPVGSAIQNAMNTDYAEEPSAQEETSSETVQKEEKNQPKLSIIKKAVKTVQKKLSHEEPSAAKKDIKIEPIVKDTSVTEERKFTPEEEELLKKIPRTEEVVVDKEIKVKTSKKYIFK